MADDIFREREHAMEATYFHARDAKLLHALRQKTDLKGISTALAEKLAVDRLDLLQRVRALGITEPTAAAFLLMPLIQMAWADGAVSKRARSAVFEAARARGISPGSLADRQLLDWLHDRPPDLLFETALEVIACGIAVLNPQERRDRIDRICDACGDVAATSVSLFRKIFGLASDSSDMQAATLRNIAAALQGCPPSD